MADQPVDIPAAFDRAVAEFDSRVKLIEDGQWDNGTPCTQWTVRDLVNHVAEEDLWAPGLLEGKTIDELGGSHAFADELGDDPRRAWLEASAAASEAVHRDGAMEATTHLSFGDFPGSFYATQLLGDHVLHAWDLARGIGADDNLDEDLVKLVYESMLPYAEALSQSDSFDEPVEVPDDADLQTKLLALVGRKR